MTRRPVRGRSREPWRDRDGDLRGERGPRRDRDSRGGGGGAGEPFGRKQPFGRERLVELQRARIVAALLRVVHERGAVGATVAHVVERAGVSRRTFYELFESCDDCLLAAFEEALARAGARVVPAYRGAGSWRERMRAALIELLAFAQEQPLLALVLLVEPAAGGPQLLARREQAQRALIAAIEEGAGQDARTAAPGPLTAECVVGGVAAVLSARLAAGDAVAGRRLDLLSLAPPLMSMIALPYLGAAVARAELGRPAPRPSGRAPSDPLPSDPFKAAGIRLTYRTVRVLSAIAELGGQGINPSNRLIAAAAEVGDQGQISKLLRRLARAGMIANTGVGGSGAPNAWTLTDSGRRVVLYPTSLPRTRSSK